MSNNPGSVKNISACNVNSFKLADSDSASYQIEALENEWGPIQIYKLNVWSPKYAAFLNLCSVLANNCSDAMERLQACYEGTYKEPPPPVEVTYQSIVGRSLDEATKDKAREVFAKNGCTKITLSDRMLPANGAGPFDRSFELSALCFLGNNAYGPAKVLCRVDINADASISKALASCNPSTISMR